MRSTGSHDRDREHSWDKCRERGCDSRMTHNHSSCDRERSRERGGGQHNHNNHSNHCSQAHSSHSNTSNSNTNNNNNSNDCNSSNMNSNSNKEPGKMSNLPQFSSAHSSCSSTSVPNDSSNNQLSSSSNQPSSSSNNNNNSSSSNSNSNNQHSHGYHHSHSAQPGLCPLTISTSQADDEPPAVVHRGRSCGAGEETLLLPKGVCGKRGSRSILIFCGGPSLDRTRPLKVALEELGCVVRIHTDADLQDSALVLDQPTLPKVGSYPSMGSPCVSELASPKSNSGSSANNSIHNANNSNNNNNSNSNNTNNNSNNNSNSNGAFCSGANCTAFQNNVSSASTISSNNSTSNPVSFQAVPDSMSSGTLNPPEGTKTGTLSPSPSQGPLSPPLRPAPPEDPHRSPFDAVLVLWSPFFQGALQNRLIELAERERSRGSVLLNDVRLLAEMQDRRKLHDFLNRNGVSTPRYIECSRDNGNSPTIEEHSDHLVVDGYRINKPFVEKPVDRRDREIYLYFRRATGGGRALVSTRESGDLEYVCRFDPQSRIRREGSFLYQEYVQSDGLVVHAVCCGAQAYGQAVHQGVMASGTQTGTASFGGGHTSSMCSSSSSTTGPATPLGETWNPGTPGLGSHREYMRGFPVILRQEEKRLARKIREVLHQSIVGITFIRAQQAGKITSHVIDVWSGMPRLGDGLFSKDIARALFGVINRRIGTGTLSRSRSVPPQICTTCKLPSMPEDEQISHSGYIPLRHDQDEEVLSISSSGEDKDDLLAVLVLCRHGARTPKQKAKAKVPLASEFAAGWLCGWLAGSAIEPETLLDPPQSFDMRTPDQLLRLNALAQQWQASGQKLGLFADALQNWSQLGECCHAKCGRDGSVLNVAMKWGGELTQLGEEGAEVLGAHIRDEFCSDIDVGSLQHDTKVYSSSEPRCQQTAAAFCRGLLRLTMPALPPIIAALVRKDGWGSLEAGGGGKNYVGGGSGGTEKTSELASLDIPWVDIEKEILNPDMRKAFRESHSHSSMEGFATAAPALVELRLRIDAMIAAIKTATLLGPLYSGETLGLLLDRYKDAVKDVQLNEPNPRTLYKLDKLLDHLEYDKHHNRSALPEEAGEIFDKALSLCAALSDAQNILEVVHRSSLEGQEREFTGLQFLYKLRWDLRVASGEVLGEEKTHLGKHETLYGEAGGNPCVRTRLYFSHNSHLQGLLIALASRPRTGSTSPTAKKSTQDATETAQQAITGRLGFLAHFVIQLFRSRSTREHRVVCHYRRNDTGPKVHLFDLTLQETDAWFTELLEGVPHPSPIGAEADMPLPG